jgi:phospholipid/cholesterol/gamma-HCH transport system substrate-binding protein
VAVILMLSLVAGVSGCAQWRGLNTLELPGTEGHGAGSFTIQAQMPDVTNLQPNARVRVADITVGSVTKIERQGWHALLTIRLNKDVDVPANATIKLGQTSLLGSVHLELAPPKGTPPQGRLHEGSVIPLANGGAYPTVEQTLAALSMVLNGGGVGQLGDITEALSTAFKGREQDLRSLIDQLDKFISYVHDQTGDIIAATDSLNNLVGKLADHQPVIDRAIDTIPQALAVLDSERDNLVEAVDQFGKFSALAADTITASKDNLIKELKEIAPVLESLANAGPALTRALSIIPTAPFPNETIDKWQRGDYANLTAVVDLTLSRLDASFFTGTRWECNLTELEMQWGRTIGQYPSPCTGGNPLTVPYRWDQGP